MRRYIRTSVEISDENSRLRTAFPNPLPEIVSRIRAIPEGKRLRVEPSVWKQSY
jgi:hypothetical protein